MSTDVESIHALWQYAYRMGCQCGARYHLDAVEVDICATEFAEHIALLLNATARNALIAPENRGLLYRQATCFVLNWRKREQCRHLREVCFSDLPITAVSSLPDSTDLFDLTYQVYIQDILRQAVASLPPKQRQCAFRYWFRQETDGEIAAALKMTPEAVRKNLQYARGKLPEILKRMGVEAEHLRSLHG